MIPLFAPVCAVLLLVFLMIYVSKLKGLLAEAAQKMHGEPLAVDVGRQKKTVLWLIAGMACMLLTYTLFVSTADALSFAISLFLCLGLLLVALKGLTFSLIIYPDKLLLSSLWLQPKVYTAKQLVSYDVRDRFGGNRTYNLDFGSSRIVRLRAAMLNDDKALESWLSSTQAGSGK